MTKDIQELIERLEKATGPDRELDGEIDAPAYTASIDAAMTLAGEDQSLWKILFDAANLCSFTTENRVRLLSAAACHHLSPPPPFAPAFRTSPMTDLEALIAKANAGNPVHYRRRLVFDALMAVPLLAWLAIFSVMQVGGYLERILP